MRTVVAFVAAIAAGLVLYVLVFTSVVHQPLTIDAIGRYMAAKQAVLRRTPAPRIVILAGSNGRFSHSCATITAATGIACAPTCRSTPRSDCVTSSISGCPS